MEEQLHYATCNWSEHRTPAEVTIRRRKPQRAANDIEGVSARNTLWMALKSRWRQARVGQSDHA